MENEHAIASGPSMPGHYEIRLRGELDERRTSWFDGLTLRREGDGNTVVVGLFADQAAIHGVLQRVRDLGLQLISVTPVPESRHTDDSDPASATDTREEVS